MINIIVPLAGIKPFSDDNNYLYPLPLIDIKGKPLIQYVLDNLNTIQQAKRFIFIVNESDCNKYHIDNTLRQLVDSSSFIYLKNKTKGAVCSVLMAIDALNQEEEMVIVNSDQVIETDYNTILQGFRNDGAAGGLITFNSVHPRWSYARIEDGLVVQTAEKNPISNHAIAGFYYFQKSSFFINGAFQAIYHDASLDDNYYTSAVFNELILDNKTIKHFQVATASYHSFYSPQKIKEFEAFLMK